MIGSTITAIITNKTNKAEVKATIIDKILIEAGYRDSLTSVSGYLIKVNKIINMIEGSEQNMYDRSIYPIYAKDILFFIKE